jgi:hypothetical protein
MLSAKYPKATQIPSSNLDSPSSKGGSHSLLFLVQLVEMRRSSREVKKPELLTFTNLGGSPEGRRLSQVSHEDEEEEDDQQHMNGKEEIEEEEEEEEEEDIDAHFSAKKKQKKGTAATGTTASKGGKKGKGSVATAAAVETSVVAGGKKKQPPKVTGQQHEVHPDAPLFGKSYLCHVSI